MLAVTLAANLQRLSGGGARPTGGSGSGSDTGSGTGSDTNRPRRRLNEAELVRLQREGILADEETGLPAPAKRAGTGRLPVVPEGPVLMDPALIRAIDLLKGLAVIQQSHRF